VRLTTARAALDRRLDPGHDAPLAVGFSGGGDSLALLKLTLDWARDHGRRVLSLTVDHGLQADSARWTREAVARAQALGAEACALAWTGPKPQTGVPAAARRARHALLARATREAGGRVLLLGHTLDDCQEAAAMRAAGSTVSDPRDWAPSPVWPEGQGVFLLRPLLAVRRETLRETLRAEGETWLEDPANDDLSYARPRARRALTGPARDPVPAGKPSGPAVPPAYEGTAAGLLYLPRDVSAAPLAMACLCVGGTERPPRGDRVQALMARLRAGEAFTATLAGARLQAIAGQDRLMLCREAGEVARGGLADLDLLPGETGLWDGRYGFSALEGALRITALRGRAAGLPRGQREALRAIPAPARGALPAVLALDGTVRCPVLGGPGLAPQTGLGFEVLFLERFRASIGLIDQESVT